MGYTVAALDPARKYGVAITGLTEKDLIHDAVRTDLVKLWIEHGLIIFRGEASSSFHVALSKAFGDLEEHPVKESRVEGRPDLIEVRYKPECETLYEVGGRQLGGWLPWHSDLVYVDRINHGGILRALMVPSEGGETGFIDQIEAYEELPADLKERVEGLHIVYKMRMNFTKQRYVSRLPLRLLRSSSHLDGVTAREDRDFPLVAHPIVYSQVETGRKVLNVSPMFAEYIHGMDNPEGHALLQRIVDHVSNETLAFYHKWTVGEMVLWDNWRMLHSCTGVSPDATRVMRRTTIAGDYAQGRKLTELELQPV